MQRKKNILDRIGALIPGYRGYAERDGRRNCDKLLREVISNQLKEIEDLLYISMTTALKKKDKEKMHELEAVRKQIDTFRSKVNYAPYGKSALFTDEKIKEDELAEIYQIDLDLATETKNLLNKVNSSTLSEISKLLVSCQELLNKRNSFINEFK